MRELNYGRAAGIMKKIWVIVVNVLIMVAMLTFVVFYSASEKLAIEIDGSHHYETDKLAKD